MTARSRRSALAGIGDHLLTLLAVAGSLCILLVIVGRLFDVSIVMFRTGSMSPTITAGSIAVVREIPATEMAVGDIVTVDRGEGILPVTHRVIALEATDEATGEVVFEMRGDGNAVEDPEPYAATEVRRVMLSVPGAAHVIQWFGSPYVLGGLTLGATALVIWAFWPRAHETDDETTEQSHAGGPQPQETVRVVAGIPLIAALVLGAPGIGDPDATVITGEHLRMQASGDPALMLNLAPGRPVIWEVGIWAEAPDPGEIDIGIGGRGQLAELPGALTIAVQSCAEPWSGSRCPSGAADLLGPESLDRIARSEPIRHLVTISSEEQRWLRIEVTLAAPSGEGAEGDVFVHAAGMGEGLTASPERPPALVGASGDDAAPSHDGRLARTGAFAAVPVLSAGLIAIVLGTALRRVRGRAAQR